MYIMTHSMLMCDKFGINKRIDYWKRLVKQALSVHSRDRDTITDPYANFLPTAFGIWINNYIPQESILSQTMLGK